jgi:hypothetical protein
VLDAAIQRATAKQPEDRFPSMAALWSALDPGVVGGAAFDATRSLPDGGGELHGRLSNGARRGWLIWTVTGLVLAASFAVTLLLLQRRRRAQPPHRPVAAGLPATKAPDAGAGSPDRGLVVRAVPEADSVRAPDAAPSVTPVARRRPPPKARAKARRSPPQEPKAALPSPDTKRPKAKAKVRKGWIMDPKID